MRRLETSEGVRFEGERCTLELRRLRPAALRITAGGDDAGELGTAPHEEVEREIRRYGPVTLMVDAREATGVAPAVPEGWLSFLRRQGDRVARMAVLVGSRQVALAVESAAALGGAGRKVSVTADVARFEADAATLSGTEPPRPPMPVTTARSPQGGAVLSVPGFRVAVTPGRAGTAEVTMAGFDGGQLSAPLFDVVADLLARAPRWEVFIDASGCTGIAGRSADAWAAWARAHRDRLGLLHVLATTPAVRLALGLEGEMGGLRPVLRVYGDPALFAEAKAALGR